MEKRLLLIAFFSLLLATAASASLDVNLDSSSVDGKNATFQCTVSSTDALTKVELYVDTTGTWAKNKTNDSVESETSAIVSFEIKNIPNGDYIWNCRAYNSTADVAAGTNGSFSVSVADEGYPQFDGPIDNQSFAEDSTLENAFDLDDYFTDDGSLTYSSSGATNVTVTISSGQVSFSSAANWSGTESITFTATDEGSLSNTSNEVLVNVTAVNDAPYYDTIPDLNWTKNTVKTIDLDDYFHDVEGSSLTYNVSTSPDNITVSFSGSDVTLSPDTDWTGTSTIVFSANDSEDTTDSNSVSLSVGLSGNNTAPVISCLGTGVAEITTTESKELTVTASDSDNDTVTMKWYVDDEIAPGQIAKSYNFSRDDTGEYVVKAMASDGTDTSSCSWTITVVELPGEAEDDVEANIEVESILNNETEPKPVCGNDIPEEGENCESCPEDAACAQNEYCSDGVCVTKQPSSTKAILIFVIITILIGIAGFIVYKVTRKKSERHLFNEATTLGKGETKEAPAVDVHDIYNKEDKKPEIKAPKRPKNMKESPLEKYVRVMKEKGFNSKQISEKLKKQGWKDEDFKRLL